MLQRKALIGIDKHGETISSDWFCEEQYLPGASFSGKAVTAKGKVRFGEPQWAANLQGDDLDPKSFKKYKEKLGAVSCAAAVPLNGSNRTFGVLEIVNKHPNSEISQFTIDDLHWLSILGLTTAFAISILRHRDRLALQTLISHTISSPLLAEDPQETYDQIATALTGPLTSYKAGIIRLGAAPDMFELTARGGSSINWEGRIEPPGHSSTLYGQVLTSGKMIVVPDIEARALDFTNLPWIRANGLRSYACFPIRLQTRVIGVLGLYAGYLNAFEESDISFIEGTCFLLACLAENFHVSGRLQLDNALVAEEGIRILGGRGIVSLNAAVSELKHRHSNILLGIGKALRELRDGSNPRIIRGLDEQIRIIDGEVNSVVKQFGSAVHSRVSVNHVAQAVVRYFSGEIRTKNIIFSLEKGEVPDIEASEAEIKDILVNLVANAVRAIQSVGQKNGHITIKTDVGISGTREWIDLQVEDNGPGIRNEIIESVFNEGFSTYGGTGMGLFITKRVVQDYDGELFVESTFGKGAIFTVRLPLKRLRWSR